MPRFYYEFCELEDDSWIYCVYDRRHGDDEIARCERGDDAERIVDALNGHKASAPPAANIFA
jgi:hypothetical protein